MAPNALDVRKMNLGPGGKQPVMRDGWNSLTNSPHAMNDSNGVPKGIRAVLQERGLWPAAGIRLSCSKKMGRLEGGCCARHLLGSQPDFQGQRGLLQEKIEERGHLVVYYPKYHPELNFIEYFWGYCKRFARENCDYTLAGLRATVPRALAAVPADTIQKFFEKSVRSLMRIARAIDMARRNLLIVFTSHIGEYSSRKGLLFPAYSQVVTS